MLSFRRLRPAARGFTSAPWSPSRGNSTHPLCCTPSPSLLSLAFKLHLNGLTQHVLLVPGFFGLIFCLSDVSMLLCIALICSCSLLHSIPPYEYATIYLPILMGRAFWLFPAGAVTGEAAMGIHVHGFCTQSFWDHRSKCERSNHKATRRKYRRISSCPWG